VPIALLAVIVQALTASIMFVFAYAMGIPLTLMDCLLVTPPVVLLSAVPISIAGWGVREGVMVASLSMIGVTSENALAISVLLGFTMLANGLLGALPLIAGYDRFRAFRAEYVHASQVSNDTALPDA